MPTTATPAVAGQFENRAPEVRRVYDRLLAAARKLGPVQEDPKKTSMREQASAHRWHVEIRLEKAAGVDRELTGWLNQAYGLAG